MAAFPYLGAHSVTCLFVHVVWATKHRACLLDPDLDGILERMLGESATAEGARLRTFGAYLDHVHVLIQLHPGTAVAVVAQRLKGASSHALRTRVAWQSGYWAETVARDAVDACAEYVRRQRVHHADRCSAEQWEIDLGPRFSPA